MDFWTLIATFIRNMFLNWLVLISWLAAAMIIPRLYLASISVEPNWINWTDFVAHYWDIGLTIALVVGFALIAIAMAYAIIDVPSTGNPEDRNAVFFGFANFHCSLRLSFLRHGGLCSATFTVASRFNLRSGGLGSFFLLSPAI